MIYFKKKNEREKNQAKQEQLMERIFSIFKRVKTKHSVMGRAIQAQESKAGQKRGKAATTTRKATLLDLRRRIRGSANVIHDKRAISADSGAPAEEKV